MGDRGPIPKRSDERVRRNSDGKTEKVTAIGPVEVPELGIPNPHPIVEDLYRSLNESAQKKYYEPSDWAHARFTLHFADKLLKSSRPSAQMLVAVNQSLSLLLMTEGDRRRVQLEVERTQAEGVVVDVASVIRQRLVAAQQSG